MKPTTAVLTFLLLLGLSYWSFEGSMPSTRPDMDLPETAFSTDRAMEHVTELSKELAKKTGYEIVNHRLDFFGVCPRCQENS